jgi:hypothetical protein
MADGTRGSRGGGVLRGLSTRRGCSRAGPDDHRVRRDVECRRRHRHPQLPTRAWTDVCGPVPLPSAALTDGDAVVDLTACGAGGAPLAWRGGERAEATAALRVHGLPTESFAGVTCAGPMQSGIMFVALLATGRIIRVEVPVVGGSCPVAAPDIGTVIARLEERDPD